MNKKNIFFSFYFILVISLSSYTSNTEQKDQKKMISGPYKQDGKEQQTGQNNIRFRDIDFDFDGKAGAGDNKKNKNKNKGGQ